MKPIYNYKIEKYGGVEIPVIESVKWQWVKKEFSSRKAEEKLEIGSYVMLHDFGKTKVLGFKRPLYEDEEDLPEGVEPCNETEIRHCENSSKLKQGQRENF
uniref:Uncharacterized protein n=1 Tax=Caldisericum exile TaxID=693075 RepID=A0A7C4TXX2_9BACT